MKETTPYRIDCNGTKYYHDCTCRRCGGEGGRDAWSYTGYICYRCRGSGIDPSPQIIKVYTPEYEEKLKQNAIKRQEKWNEEHKEEIEAQRKYYEELARKKEEEERQRLEELSQLEHFGNIGDRVEICVKVTGSYKFENQFKSYFTPEYMFVNKMTDNINHIFTWITATSLTVNQEYIIKGTIKKHNEYRNEKQTELTRCRFKEAK